MAEYIEKQAAIYNIEKSFDKETILNGFVRKIAASAVRRMEPADVRPVVRGKWKITSIYIKCLECGECFMLIPQNFCPNCGADMRGYECE